MNIEITQDEKKTLLFYLSQAKIDAECAVAIGIGNAKSVKNIKSVIKKLNKEEEVMY